MLGGRPVHAGSIFTYSRRRYPFAKVARELLRVGELSRLHVHARHYPLFDRTTDQSTTWHQRYYVDFDAKLSGLYSAFVDEIIRPLFGPEEIAVQRIPNLRIQLPGNVGVGEFHCDRDYGHPDGEINFLLPLTAAVGTNTIWIESARGAGDYRPVDLASGEFYCFDGLNLKHGNRINETEQTRVSMDFRVIPTRLCPTVAAGRSINTGSRFAVGDYYYVHERAQERTPSALQRSG
jgi:hypothetical protein